MGTTVLILVSIDRQLCVGNSVVLVLYYFNNNSNNMAHKDDDNFMMVSRIGTVEYRFQINFLR
jgi:hypothetical protein